MKPNWLLVVSFKTELLSEYPIHKGYREDLPNLLPRLGLLRNRMIIDNDIYVDLNEVATVQNILSENLIKYADEAYAIIEEQSARLLAVAKKVQQDTGIATNKILIEKLKEFFTQYQKALGAIGIPTIIDLTIEPALKSYIKDVGISNIEEAFGKLAISSKPVATNQELIDLIDIAIEKSKGKNVDQLVKSHNQKYGWLHSTLFLGDEYTPEKILAEISYLEDPAKEKERILEERRKQLAEADAVISKLSGEGKVLARFLQKAVYFRTARLEWMNQACFMIRPLMNEVATKLGLNYGDLIYLYPEEIYRALANPADLNKTVLQERHVGYAFISDDQHEYALFTGEKLREWKDKYSLKYKTDVVKGLVACKGNVKGTVVLVKDRSELGKVQSGNIIVTPLTTPDFIIAMKKAGAIITDRGGMTSHAAIVSRELGIPCIVGTKIATKILKDGDMVQVDAEKGVVIKI